jgi:transposase
MAHTHTIALVERDNVAELRRAIRTSGDEAQRTRLRAIIGIREGESHTAMARLLVVSRTSIIAWIKAYNTDGVSGLAMSKGGRPEGNPRWDSAIFDDLAREIDKGGRYWSVPLMQEWIREKYEKEIPGNTVWYHVTDLDYTYKSARPHPMKGDTATQEAFKKGVSQRQSARRSGEKKR